MKKLSAVFALIVILITGCDKENPTNPSVTLNEKALKIIFSNNYCEAEGWAIVYTEDGLTVLDTAKFFGNTIVDFGEIAQERITLTIVTTQISNQFKSYLIQTYYSVKKGEWKISDRVASVEGKLDINMSFPIHSYDNVLLSYGGGYESFTLNADTASSFHFPLLNVYNTNSVNSLSLYSTIYNLSEGIGFYNWSPKLNFTLNDTNAYNIELTNPLTLSQIQFNKEVSGINIKAFLDSFSEGVTLFHNYNPQPLTAQKVFLPDDINASSYMINVSNHSGNRSYSYEKLMNSIPGNLTIPNTIVSATHNSSNNSIENITVNGNIDYFTAVWFDSNINNNFYWIAYAPNNYTSVVRPELPPSIASQLSNFNPAQMDIYDLIIEDNNKFSSFDDLINYYYKSTVPIPDNFTERYTYGIIF